MTRGERLRRWLAYYGLSDHELATALAERLPTVRGALAGSDWFDERTEWRLSLYLETPRDEWVSLD